ncbi:hypothetical protein KIH39_02895 [Telmatocola sphagniphila]|uniref:Uncharacterized protein n=1 Tax=Telmatocola sphagniphila TaxID=1123043 RepID=A0A8E6B983_9BACT|nr:hypothetical protein [Telmatocola sphagniphila]QVL32883.1 hypothetical protein KIH39_02895 [Telmatocola sphagniphila]
MAAVSKSSDPSFGVYPPEEHSVERLEERVRLLEEEVVELRNVVTTFGDLFVGTSPKDSAPTATVPRSDSSDPIAAVATQALKKTFWSRLGNWPLFELYSEVILIFRMYIDPRYRMRRMTQLVIPAIAMLFVGSYFFFNYLFALPILSTILERAIEIFLAILLYKVLLGELVRYKEVLQNFANWNNLRRPTVVTSGGEDPHTPMEMD